MDASDRESAEEKYCEVGGRRFPIVMQDRQGRVAQSAMRWFTGGEEGPHEAGFYSFWSVLAGPVALFIFRTREGREVDERLRDYVSRTERRAELLQQFGDRVMPSTCDEIDLWLKTHPVDASFAISSSTQARDPA